MEGYVIYDIDTETTGTNHEKHDVIELSLTRIIFGNTLSREQRTWYMKPMFPENIDDEALAVNGYKKEDLLHKTEYGRNTFKEQSIVLPEIELWIAEDGVSALDRVLIGHNIDFDAEGIQGLWRKNKTFETFPFDITYKNRTLDTKDLVLFIDICTGKRRKQYNQNSCVKAFKIKKGKAHKAEEDCRMNSDLFIKCVEEIKPIIGKRFEDCYIDE